MEQTLEIFFKEEFIFPYIQLEEMNKQHPDWSESSIYLVMLSNKYKIMEIKFENQLLIVKYQDETKNTFHLLSNIKIFPFYIPDHYVEVRIVNFGIMLEIEITQSGIDFIKKNHPNYYYDSFYHSKISIYDLINLSFQHEETTQYFTILYIGQSITKENGRTIYDRLNDHEKILKIYRDYNTKYQDQEIFIMLLKPDSKLFNAYNSDENLLTMVLGNSEWESTDNLGEAITKSTIINITETMLIQHFKPEYNIHFKNSNPTLNIKSYSELHNAEVNEVHIGINLYFQPMKQNIYLFTIKESVTSKLRMLKCNIDNLYTKEHSSKIYSEDLSDEMYEIFGLNN